MSCPISIIVYKGTRSKRRGLDESGACANYVETEQVSGTAIIIGITCFFMH